MNFKDKKGFISPKSFLNFFLNLYVPQCLPKSFEVMVLRLLANTFVSHKTESDHFYPFSQAKPLPRFLSLSTERRKLSIPPEQRFLKMYFSRQKGGRRIMKLKKLPKLNLRGHWSQVLINSTIFAIFTLSVSVLLCNNPALSMVKCEGSLT